jgi:D-threo-aldose 1-dehydrogenase
MPPSGIEPSARRRLGRTNVEVTRLGFGGAALGNLFHAVAETAARDAVHTAYSAGIRFFDTAPFYGYGLSERRIGDALRSVPRDSYVLSTKVGRLLVPRRQTAATDTDGYVDTLPFDPVYDYSYEGVMRSVEDSLQRIGTDRIDVLLIHDIGAVTHGEDQHPALFRTAMTGGYRALDALRRQGLVGAVGLGVNEWQVCREAMEEGAFDCFLLAGRYTLLDQQALTEFLPECARREISIILGGPFNSGILASGGIAGATYDYRPAGPEILGRVRRLEAVCKAHGVPLAAAALQFPLHHPAVASVIPGARTPREVEANLALLQQPIPSALWHDLKKAGLVAEAAPTP